MPLFRRALWPQDHRDELVAGALVGAVVVVLGYASGLGAPAASSDATAAPPPPAATSPPPPEGTAPPQTPGNASGGGAAGAGGLPVTDGFYPSYPGGTGTNHAGHPGHAGFPTPAPSGSTPPPSPSPSPPGTTPPADDEANCEDGEVHLVRPLLTGLTEPVFGLLDPADDSTGTPAPQPSPCVGLAPLSSLLGGTGSPSPSPEATP